MLPQTPDNKSKVAVVIVTLSLVAAIVLGVLSLQPARPTEAGFVLVEDYLDAGKAIQYIGNVDDTGSPFGMVMYDASSPQSLQAYASASQSKGQSLVASGVGQLYVWITFRQPLEINSFESLARRDNLQVKRYSLRAMGQKGTRITISGGPDDGSIVPSARLDSAMNDIQVHESKQAQLKGVYEAVGVISATDYQELLRDPRVFMIDVTGTLIYNDPGFQNKTHMSWDEFTAKFQIDGGPGGPYWYVEDYGLGKGNN